MQGLLVLCKFRRQKLCLKKILSPFQLDQMSRVFENKIQSPLRCVLQVLCGVLGVFHLCSHWQELFWGVIDSVLYLFTKGPCGRALDLISLLGLLNPRKMRRQLLGIFRCALICVKLNDTMVFRHQGAVLLCLFPLHRRCFIMQPQGFVIARPFLVRNCTKQAVARGKPRIRLATLHAALKAS